MAGGILGFMAEDAFVDRLRADIEKQKQLLMDVSNWAANIRDVNDEYKDRRSRIRSQLKALGLEDPNPWSDLWLWYGHYKDNPGLASYQDRRELVLRTYQPLLDALENIGERRLGTGITAPATGWTEVDRQVGQLRESYARAETPEQYRQVGLLCRDIFISLGHVVFDPDKHLPAGAAMPKRDDAKNRLEWAVRSEYRGESGEKMRGLVRATLEFVQPVVHDRTHDRTKAMIAADATVHLVKVLAALFPSPTGKPPTDEDDEHEDYDWEPSEDDWREYLESAITDEELSP
jgi:hypothetical protein